MSTTSPESEHDDHRVLPEPISFEDMVTTQETRNAPSPTMGRDAETEWLLRNSG